MGRWLARCSSSAQDASTSESTGSDSCQDVPRAHVVPLEPHLIHSTTASLETHRQECCVKSEGGSER